MSLAKSTTKYVRVPPRKARLVADMIRNVSVEKAYTILSFCDLKAGRLFLKTLNSAVANALTTQDTVQKENLFVVDVRVDEGPMLKRAKPKNKGGKVPVLKRTSHLVVAVGEQKKKGA